MKCWWCCPVLFTTPPSQPIRRKHQRDMDQSGAREICQLVQVHRNCCHADWDKRRTVRTMRRSWGQDDWRHTRWRRGQWNIKYSRKTCYQVVPVIKTGVLNILNIILVLLIGIERFWGCDQLSINLKIKDIKILFYNPSLKNMNDFCLGLFRFSDGWLGRSEMECIKLCHLQDSYNRNLRGKNIARWTQIVLLHEFRFN